MTQNTDAHKLNVVVIKLFWTMLKLGGEVVVYCMKKIQRKRRKRREKGQWSSHKLKITNGYTNIIYLLVKSLVILLVTMWCHCTFFGFLNSTIIPSLHLLPKFTNENVFSVMISIKVTYNHRYIFFCHFNFISIYQKKYFHQYLPTDNEKEKHHQ